MAFLKSMLVIVMIAGLQDANASSCEVEHPQKAINRAHFVVKGRVISTDWQPPSQEHNSLPQYLRPRYIQVEVHRVFKWVTTVNATKYSHVFIRVASPQGIKLQEGHLYVLTGFSFGKMLFMNDCNFKSKWSDLTQMQKIGIANYFYVVYRRCRIVECNGENSDCENNLRACSWNSKKDDMSCLAKNKICMVRNGMRCDWMGHDAETC